MSEHEWAKSEWDENEVDIFAYEYGPYCNGPKCVKCGFGFCHHCHRDWYETECPK